MNYNAAQDQRGRNTVRVVKLITQETGSHNPLYLRPYNTFVDEHTLNGIVNRVQNTSGHVITGNLFSGIASSIITPTATPQQMINIPYGWAERRIRFMMEVSVISATGHELFYYFQGYTDYLGITPNGVVDMNMQFIINSFICVVRTQVYTQAGVQFKDVIKQSCQILDGKIVNQSSANGDTYCMRPQDIFSGIQMNYLRNGYNLPGHGGNANFIDTRGKITMENLGSNRTNNVSSNFLANVVDYYQHAQTLGDFGQSDQDIYERCRQDALARDPSLSENIFLRKLSNIRGYGVTTSFTMKDLCSIDPDAGKVVSHVALGTTSKVQLHQAGQTAYWNSSDRETLISTILSNAVPALMMELMFSKLHFRSTNHDARGMMNTVFIDAKSLCNADLSVNFEIFKRRMEREIMFDITYGGQDLYTLDMKADMFGETIISISIGGGPIVTYCTPSFCDGLMTPVLTGNSDNFHNVAQDFEHIFAGIRDAVPTVARINELV